MINVPYHSTVANIVGSTIIMKSAGPSPYRAGDTIRLMSDMMSSEPRYGSLGVTRVDEVAGVLHVDADVRAAIPAACEGDAVAIEVSDTLSDDHAALVAYLLSCVRRHDWHAVSDAANDLRVIEAKRR